MLKKITLVCCAIIIASCGSYSATTQKDPLSFIQFVGLQGNESLQLDDGASQSLSSNAVKQFKLEGVNVAKLSVKPGKHRLVVMRLRAAIIERTIYIGPDSTFEVAIP